MSPPNRPYQAPDIVRVSAPCYLKRKLYEHSRTKVKYCEVIWELMQATHPGIKVSPQGPADLRVPVVRK